MVALPAAFLCPYWRSVTDRSVVKVGKGNEEITDITDTSQVAGCGNRTFVAGLSVCDEYFWGSSRRTTA